jgi:hypothetical protein
VVPILLLENPEMLIGNPFFGHVVASFLTEHYNIPWINLVVVDHFLVGVSYWGSHPKALKLFWRGGSGTTRWGVLTKAEGLCPLDKLLRLSNRNPT